MSKILSFIVFVLFSTQAFAQFDNDVIDLTKDFEVFPLTTNNIALLEGVWRGDDVDIKITDSGFRLGQKPMMWINMSNHKADEQRSGVMYYSPSAGHYKLYVYRGATVIPIKLGMLEFSSSYASKQGLSCGANGGALLKIEFEVESVFGEVVLTKESCY